MIDEIYELFAWNADLLPEEYENRVSRGLYLAAELRWLHPLIQPQCPGLGVSLWDPCARALAQRSDEELRPHLYQLLEWLQDLNWPGADIIRSRLLQFPYPCLEPSLNCAITTARRTSDDIWLQILEDFRQEAKPAVV